MPKRLDQAGIGNAVVVVKIGHLQNQLILAYRSDDGIHFIGGVMIEVNQQVRTGQFPGEAVFGEAIGVVGIGCGTISIKGNVIQQNGFEKGVGTV